MILKSFSLTLHFPNTLAMRLATKLENRCIVENPDLLKFPATPGATLKMRSRNLFWSDSW